MKIKHLKLEHLKLLKNPLCRMYIYILCRMSQSDGTGPVVYTFTQTLNTGNGIKIVWTSLKGIMDILLFYSSIPKVGIRLLKVYSCRTASSHPLSEKKWKRNFNFCLKFYCRQWKAIQMTGEFSCLNCFCELTIN